MKRKQNGAATTSGDGSATNASPPQRDALQPREWAAPILQRQRDAAGGPTVESLKVALEQLRTAEEELRSQHEELIVTRSAVEAGRQRYQDLFEFAPDAYLVTNIGGLIQEANRAAAALLGVNSDELVKKPLAVFFAGADRRRFRSELYDLAGSNAERSWEIGLTPRRGQRRPCEIKAAAIRGPDGRPTEFRWLIRDISERKEAQARTLQTERLSAIGQMITGLAHESRNALQRSQACLSMLSMEVQDRPGAMAFIERLRQAQHDLHRLYENVRQYAAPMNLVREWCDLRSLVDEVWANLLAVDPERQARLIQTQRGPMPASWSRPGDAAFVNGPETAASLPHIFAHVDKFTISQVLRNIFENSLSAGPDPVEVMVAWATVFLNDRLGICISMRDNGPGLSAEARRRMFEPFFTTKTHGTGLGMAISKRIMEHHGGSIELGKPGKPGTEIIVNLPRSE